MIYLKSEEQIAGIKDACAIWKKVRSELLKFIRVGITTKAIDLKARELIISYGAIPTFYQLYNFPNNICICANHELIHGVASDYTLKENDLVTLDIGVTYKGYICDAAFSLILQPNTDQEKKQILKATYAALMQAIEIIKPGIYTGDIGYSIETTASKHGYEVIKDFTGHGCGIKPHEDPSIFNYGIPGTGTRLVPGMVLCLEPMLLTDSDEYVIDKKNKWTVTSKNKKLTCHFEHMVLVTENGNINLTYCEDEKHLINN